MPAERLISPLCKLLQTVARITHVVIICIPRFKLLFLLLFWVLGLELKVSNSPPLSLLR